MIVSGRLKKLTFFDITDNHVADLPVTFSSCLTLTTVVLDGNHFTAIPECLTYLRNLEVHLFDAFKIFYCIRHSKSVVVVGQVLSMNDNRLDEIPPDLCYLQSLTYLSLARNRIEFLNATVCKIHSIQVLDLRGNHMTNLPPEVSGDLL